LGLTPGGAAYYERIGVGFELPNIYHKLTARENLAFFGALYSRPLLDIDALLDRVGLSQHADTRAQDMSKGMKMRVNFCRAILHQPDVLFLDEPTSGLDPAIASSLRTLISEQARRGATILLSTHNMQEATELCDHLAFLIDGSLIASDTPHNLMRAHGRREIAVEHLGHDQQPHTQLFALDGLHQDQAFLDTLRDQHILSIHSREASLHDVFVKLTGRAIS
jgi:fluoroquinolone transport system ATP-binding protein